MVTWFKNIFRHFFRTKFKKCPRSVNNFRTKHLGGYFWDFWSPYVPLRSCFPEGSQKRKFNDDDQHDHGKEKRRSSTYVEEKKVFVCIYGGFLFLRVGNNFSIRFNFKLTIRILFYWVVVQIFAPIAPSPHPLTQCGKKSLPGGQTN